MRQLFNILLWIFIFLILIASSNYFININAYPGIYDVLDILTAHIWLFLLLIILLQCQPTKTPFCQLITAMAFCVMLFMFLSTVIELLIFQYSNVGFIDQTFLHFELESLWVGLKVSPIKYILSMTGAFLLVFIWIKFKPKLNLTKTGLLVNVFILLSTLIFVNFQGTAAGRLIAGYLNFHSSQKLIELSAKDVEGFQEFGINPVYQNVSTIKAQISGPPKNLIIVYLESFSREFITNNRYPGLTPEINNLIQRHGELTNYHATAKYTIQGLISSLCGVVPKLQGGNNLSLDQLPYKHLPCLPDILNVLGYHQAFFGGARKTFANKEAFLKSKSYDEVWGWVDYKKPKNYQTNDWGLQDSDLFNIALNKIKSLAQKEQPFNVSLLTLATHLNGNPDPICPKYKKPDGTEDKFLNGIHCTDYLLGQFIKNLDKEGILDHTTLFITSDHGVFNVSIIKDLFGSNIDTHQLFGLLINGSDFDKSLPIGLYDMPAILLESLKIKSNINFINGISPSKISKNRFLLRESDMFRSFANTNHCNEGDVISAPLDKCEIDRLISKTWQHAASFSTRTSLNNDNSHPVIDIQASTKKSKSHITINGRKQINLFLKEGYPVSINARKYHNHVYLLIYDTENHEVIERSAYRFESKYTAYFKEALMRHKDNKHAVFIIVTEGGQPNNKNKAWNQLFKQLGSRYFNFPAKAYIGILNFIDGNPQIVEWQSKDDDQVVVSIDNLEKYL